MGSASGCESILNPVVIHPRTMEGRRICRFLIFISERQIITWPRRDKSGVGAGPVLDLISNTASRRLYPTFAPLLYFSSLSGRLTPLSLALFLLPLSDPYA